MEKATRRRPWYALPLFVTAIVYFAGSLIYLAAAIYFGLTDGPESGSETIAASPGPSATAGPLLVRGTLPAGEHGIELQAGEPADLQLTPTQAPSGIAIRYWALVASPSAALPVIAVTDRLRLLNGEIASIEELGGRGTKPVVAAGPEVPATGLTGAWAPTETYATWEELRARLASVEAPAFAFVPVDEIDARTAIVRIIGSDGRPDYGFLVDRVEVYGLTPRGQEARAGIVRAIEVTRPEPARIILTGDILLARCTASTIRALGDWTAPFKTTLGDLLRGADLTLGSLDGSIQDINPIWGCGAATNLAMPPEAVQTLVAGGIDGVTLATNHALDCGQDSCGRQAMLRSIALLDQAGIKHTGGGATLEDALGPMIFDIGGVRIGVLGFDDIAAEDYEATATDPGTAPLDDSYADEQAALPREPAFYKPASMLNLERFTARIQSLKALVDIVIVQIQSGTEDTHDPSPRSIKGLRAAVDAGADLVVGNQAHWVQAAEFRGDVFVTYALGNFIFDQRHTPQHFQGVLLEAEIWGKRIAQVRLIPYEIVALHRPELADGGLRRKVLDDVWSAAERLAEAE